MSQCYQMAEPGFELQILVYAQSLCFQPTTSHYGMTEEAGKWGALGGLRDRYGENSRAPLFLDIQVSLSRTIQPVAVSVSEQCVNALHVSAGEKESFIPLKTEMEAYL